MNLLCAILGHKFWVEIIDRRDWLAVRVPKDRCTRCLLSKSECEIIFNNPI